MFGLMIWPIKFQIEIEIPYPNSSTYKYRVSHLLASLGWVDLNLDPSTIMLRYRSGPTARRTPKIEVKPTQIHEEMRHPVDMQQK